MEFLKAVHVGAALLSIIGFIVRAMLAMRDSPVMQLRWVKVVPHCIDSVLLISAIMLAYQYGFTPFNSPWLAVKILALLIYIALGFVVLRFSKNNSVRLAAFVAAVMTFGIIVFVATNKAIVG